MSGLNDVDIETVAGLAGKIQQEPGVADTKWNASVNWKGGFRSEARVRDFGPIVSDEPGALGGTDTGPNPVEQVLAALGNCLAVGYAANASAAGIEIRDMRIELEGDLDLHTFLGLAPDGNAGRTRENRKSTSVPGMAMWLESMNTMSPDPSAANGFSPADCTVVRSRVTGSPARSARGAGSIAVIRVPTPPSAAARARKRVEWPDPTSTMRFGLRSRTRT